MSRIDAVSDFLTRLRNAAKAKHKSVEIPASNLKKSIAEILLQQKYIAGYSVLEDSKQGILRVQLKYSNGQSVMQGLRRVSRPGLRQYRTADKLPRVLGGLGIAIVSTPRGLMTDAQARKNNIGGEVLAFIW